MPGDGRMEHEVSGCHLRLTISNSYKPRDWLELTLGVSG